MRKKSFLIISLLSMSIFFSFVSFAHSTPPETATWSITGTVTFTGDSYDVYYSIYIQTGAVVEFSNCEFNFLNETDEIFIKVNPNAELILSECVLNGMEIGNAYIEVDDDANLTIKDSTLTNMGTGTRMAIETHGNFVKLEGTELYGKYCGLSASSPIASSNLIIKSCILDDDNASMRPAIAIFDQADILIEDSSILGYVIAIDMGSVRENITIYNNTVKYQENDAIFGWIAGSIPQDQGINITDNVIDASNRGIYTSGAKHSNIIGNQIATDWTGIFIGNGINQTVANNTMTYRQSVYADFNAITLKDSFDNKLSNNSYVTPSSGEVHPTNFFNIEGTGLGSTMLYNNTINGKVAQLLKGITDYSAEIDKSSEQDIGELYVWQCTGLKIANLNITDSSALVLDECTDLVVENCSINNAYSRILIQDSDNCTIANSSVESIIDLRENYVNIHESTNCTLYNTTMIGDSSLIGKCGVGISKSINTTIDTGIFETYDVGIQLWKSNGSLIMDSTFHCLTALSIIDTSCYNNFTQNEIVKWGGGQDQYIYNDVGTTKGNIFDYNHWSGYWNANDTTPENGIADEPHQIYVVENTFGYDYYPLFIDTDSDDLDDFQEIYHYKTDPEDDDSDDDNLLDGEEVVTGADGFVTNPNDEDTDGDALTDWEEVSAFYGYDTDPTKEDSDGDDFNDYYEIMVAETDPADIESYPGGTLDAENTEIQDEEEDPIEDNTTGMIPGFGYIMPLTILLCVFSGFLVKKKIKINENISDNRRRALS
ncbi:MAG: hypothetical protein GF364_05580 [Candidatus Lokiarchaeota archaeon]|nr:hypothetical protein [Candidatus Lokiarchaeota archaeon]